MHCRSMYGTSYTSIFEQTAFGAQMGKSASEVACGEEGQRDEEIRLDRELKQWLD